MRLPHWLRCDWTFWNDACLVDPSRGILVQWRECLVCGNAQERFVARARVLLTTTASMIDNETGGAGASPFRPRGHTLSKEIRPPMDNPIIRFKGDDAPEFPAGSASSGPQ